MRISGSDPNIPGVNLLGNMSKIGERLSNLIFIYPILIDKSLSKNWDNLLRDFQTAQFIAQIKISNVLNITQAAVQGYGETAGVPYLNPAELLNQTLSNNREEFRNALQQQLNILQSQQFNNQNRNKPSNTEYAYKLQEFRNFIKQQILTDPIYSDLRPAFSIISLENSLLDIPLVVGTKSYTIDSGALYWILFICLLNNKNLTLNSFSEIEALLNNLPKNTFLDIVSSSQLLPPNTDTNNYDLLYNRLRKDTNVGLSKALSTFKKVATTLQEFESDLGFSVSIKSEAVQYTTVLNSSIAEKAEMKSKIISLLNQAIITSIFPVIQTINNLIVNPALETNYIARYKKLLSEILTIINPLVDNFIGLYTNRFSQNETSKEFLTSLESNCKSLQQVKSYDLLMKLDEIRLRFTEIRNDVEGARRSNSRVIDFAEELTRVSSSLAAQTQTLIAMVSNFTGSSEVKTLYNNLIAQLNACILNYFEEQGTPENNLGGSIVTRGNHQVSRFFGSVFPGVNNNDLFRFLTNSTQALSETLAFLIFYSIFSYFCEFISIIKGKIEVKSKDVIEFPNYTLVIPIEFVTTLYYALAAKNTSDLLKNLNSSKTNEEFRAKQLPQSLDKFKLTETEIFRIVNAITERLNVKNLIIVDSNKNEIYYKWSYSKRSIKLNQSTLINYIKSQNNITAAF